MEDIDLAVLREGNSAEVGWVWIPDTKINYPLMQGEDNNYYLKGQTQQFCWRHMPMGAEVPWQPIRSLEIWLKI